VAQKWVTIRFGARAPNTRMMFVSYRAGRWRAKRWSYVLPERACRDSYQLSGCGGRAARRRGPRRGACSSGSRFAIDLPRRETRYGIWRAAAARDSGRRCIRFGCPSFGRPSEAGTVMGVGACAGGPRPSAPVATGEELSRRMPASQGEVVCIHRPDVAWDLVATVEANMTVRYSATNMYEAKAERRRSSLPAVELTFTTNVARWSNDPPQAGGRP
jgi:hypothetical protein